jgi:hypothetical protein
MIVEYTWGEYPTWLRASALNRDRDANVLVDAGSKLGGDTKITRTPRWVAVCPQVVSWQSLCKACPKQLFSGSPGLSLFWRMDVTRVERACALPS